MAHNSFTFKARYRTEVQPTTVSTSTFIQHKKPTMTRNENSEDNNCLTMQQQTNVNLPVDSSTSSTAGTEPDVLGGSPSHGNIVSVTESIEKSTLERGLIERMGSFATSPNRANIHGEGAPPSPSAPKSDEDFAKSEKKSAEINTGRLETPVRNDSLDRKLDGSVDVYISQYKFETSIDEESLRSFLEISGSSPERSEASKDGLRFFPRGEGDARNDTAPQMFEYGEAQQLQTTSDSEKDSVLTGKCTSESIAGSSDSYHTAQESVTHEEFPKDVMNAMAELLIQEKSDETQADQFETSIDEESLRSFLEISVPSLEGSEASKVGHASFRRSEVEGRVICMNPPEIEYNQPQLHEHTNDSDKSITLTVNCRSESTSESYQTALESLSHNEPLKEAMNSMEEPRTQEKSHDAEQEVLVNNVALYLTSRSAVIKKGDLGAGVPKKEEISERKVEEQSAEAVETHRLRHKGSTKQGSQANSGGKKTDHERSISAEVSDSLRKNRSHQSQKEIEVTATSKNTTLTNSRTHAASSTKVKTRKTGLENFIRQKNGASSRAGRSSGHLTERQGCPQKKDEHPKQKNIDNPSKSSVKRSGRPVLKRANTETEAVSFDEKPFSAKSEAKCRSKRAEKDGRSGSSQIRRTRSAGKKKQEQRGVLKPKRRGERNKRPIPISKQRKSQDRIPRGDRRRMCSGKRLNAPISISAKDGICIDEEALVQLQEDIIREVHDVVRALHHGVQKGYNKEKSKIGLKLVIFENDK